MGDSQHFHLTSVPTASLFDVWAEGSLRNSIKPAWEYLCKTLETKYSGKLSKILKYSDEIFYLLLLIVEEYNLRKKSASITESFYELTRQCASSKQSFAFRNAKWISLVSIVILPYITEKLEEKYKQIKEEIAINPNSLSLNKQRFLMIYPKLSSIAKWFRVVNYILYVFNYSGYPNPVLYLTRMQLKYGTNLLQNNKANMNDQKIYIRILSGISNTLSSMFSKLVPFMLHGLQFVDVFYQKDLLSTISRAMLPVDTPPGMPQVNSVGVKLPPSEKQCPLCRQPHSNPTTIAISGFVFCYACIYRYVEMHNCCPITYRPCNTSELITIQQ